MIHKMENEFLTPATSRLDLSDRDEVRAHDTVDERMVRTAALMLLKISDAADTFMDAEAQI